MKTTIITDENVTAELDPTVLHIVENHLEIFHCGEDSFSGKIVKSLEADRGIYCLVCRSQQRIARY